MEIKMEELLNIYKANELDDYIKRLTGFTLNEGNLTDEKILKKWKFVGNNPSNGSVINMLKDSEKGIIERLTNGIDAVLEKEKMELNISSAKNADVIVEKAFPKFFKNKKDILNGNSTSAYAYDASDKVVLVINDGSKTNKPTIDIIDQGSGIKGEDFIDTILSINKGNKLSNDKKYLIGAFGQGGSTSLPCSYATIIVSKYNGCYSCTIIKSVELIQYKNFAYVYMCDNGKIADGYIYDLNSIENEQIKKFLNSKSGTLVRMIETDISKEFRANDISKPGMLGDYVNTELFNVALPIKMVENRSNYTGNKHAQNRNSFGSYSKLHSWKYSRKDLNGSISIIHNDRPYKLDYYIILPESEDKWGNDTECKNVYRQFNVHGDPIIYTVNGQYVSSERFLKLKNASLSFLQYRLLVVVDLDNLGTEKYRFFTSDRSRIRNSDLTRGFIDKVIDSLKKEETIINMNQVIAEKSINCHVDSDLIVDIANEVKNIYGKFLKKGNTLNGRQYSRNKNELKEEVVYVDYIDYLEIITANHIFSKNEPIRVTLVTGATKSVNENSLIIFYLDGKAFYSFNHTVMNGKIQYTFTCNASQLGAHNIFFQYFEHENFEGNEIKSNTFEFEIIDEPINPKDQKKEKNLNLDIQLVNEKELIVSVIKDKQNKKINAFLCLNHDLMNDVYSKCINNDQIQEYKKKFIKPLTLFVLFLDNSYDDLENDEERNKMVVSFAKTLVATNF